VPRASLALQAQCRAAGVEGEAAGGVQEPVAQGLVFADGQLVVEREQLGPGDEVLGDERYLHPDGVVIKAAEREVFEAGLLGGADAVLGVSAGAVQALEPGRVAVEVGQGSQEAVAVVVGEGQLGAEC
jgi:hypothetical protein